VGIPYERREDLRRFYLDVLGLRPWPAEAQIPGGWGVGDAWRGLYLQYRHDPGVEPMRKRFAIAVVDLDRFENRLRRYEWPYRRFHGLSLGEQFIWLRDPAGHAIEVRQSRPL